MQVFLLVEAKKTNLFKRLFKKVKLSENIITINCKCEKMKLKKKIKIIKKVKAIVGKNNKLIISKNLKKNKEFVNLLYSNEFDIVNGKKLFKLIIVKFIDFVCKDNKIKCEEAQLGITINDTKNFNQKYIEELAKKFKSINIVTNNVKYLKKLEEHLWVENGIVMTVTNNKKKALIKSDIILNVDFPEEIINKYSIYDKSILINLEEKVKIKKKRFCGKILNEYKIKPRKQTNIQKFLEKSEYQEFDLNDLTEIYIINNPSEIDDIIICK